MLRGWWPRAAASLALVASFVPLVARAAERVILERSSTYNSIVVGETDAGLRVLRFGLAGVRQSVVKLGDPDHLELPYAKAAPLMLAFVPEPASVLVIGLGGGTLPMFLRKHFPRARIDAVEIDAEVVAVAKSHFGFREDANLRAHVADGRRFVENAKQTYDLVIMDAFGVDSTPYALVTREFLVRVRSLLTPRGVLFGNLWGRESNRLYDSMVRTYADVFASIGICEVRDAGNRLVIAYNWLPRLSKEEVLGRASDVQKRLALRQNLVAIVRDGFREPMADGVGGMILYDATPPR